MDIFAKQAGEWLSEARMAWEGVGGDFKDILVRADVRAPVCDFVYTRACACACARTSLDHIAIEKEFRILR